MNPAPVQNSIVDINFHYLMNKGRGILCSFRVGFFIHTSLQNIFKK